MQFLVDECLSPALPNRLRQAGYHAMHVRDLGLRSWSDEALMSVILDGDWTFVTANAFDFRGPDWAPGKTGGYSGATIHAGLVCLNMPYHTGRDRHFALLDVAIEALSHVDDLVNRVLEVTLRHDQAIDVALYDVP